MEEKHLTKTNRAINKLIYLALIVLALAVGVFLYWSFQSEKILVVNNEPFPVRTIREATTPDGVVILTLDYCKNEKASGPLRISFVNNVREYFLPLRNEDSDVGCKVIEYPVLVPEGIEDGEYRIKFVVDYNLNPIKKNVHNEFYSQPVKVSPEQ